jgi:hypothetical protein
MEVLSSWREQICEQGYAIRPGFLECRQINELVSSLDVLQRNALVQRRGGIRNLLELSPEVKDLSKSETIRNIVCPVLGNEAFAVRGILFDKTDNANWKVPWHQDLTIAVSEKVDSEGFGPWSVKEGVQHVQPPVSILENMLSVRIHLDDCPSENGALRVIPGSHKLGRLSDRDATGIGAKSTVVVCEAKAGDALLMRPLLLHASSPSEKPGHRRVIHLDFASAKLPGELRWAAELLD